MPYFAYKARDAGGKLIEGAPRFIRCIHEVNDSRVKVGRNWQEIENWQQDEALRSYAEEVTAGDR